MKKGFLAGSFDVIHPGYIAMFEEASQHCDSLIVGLQIDPTLERPEKLSLILDYKERYKTLSSIKYIDQIYPYTTEADLELLLTTIKPDIRFLGEDYKDKSYTAEHLNIPIYYTNRDHGWSTTKFKTLIYQQIQNEKINSNRNEI